MRTGFLVIVLLAPAAPAWGQAAQPAVPGEAFVVLSGRAVVPAGQQVGDLVVVQGSAAVDGTVNGSVTAFNAPVTISGRVNGDVVVFNGRVELRTGANVTGDVLSQQAPVVAPGATIGGEVRRIGTNVDWRGFGWVSQLAWWLAITVSTLVAGLVLLWLAGRFADQVLLAARGAVGPAIGWGLLLFFGLPAIAFLAMFTLVGLPLGFGLLAALIPIHALGYTAAAWILGRSILRPPTSWILAFLLGWGILRLLALIPFVGGLAWFAAVVYGLGAIAVAAWRSRATRVPAPAAA